MGKATIEIQEKEENLARKMKGSWYEKAGRGGEEKGGNEEAGSGEANGGSAELGKDSKSVEEAEDCTTADKCEEEYEVHVWGLKTIEQVLKQRSDLRGDLKQGIEGLVQK